MNNRRLWAIIDRQKAAYRHKGNPIFMRAFDMQIKPLYDKIAETSDIRDVIVPELDNKAIEEAYKRLYMMTVVPFALKERKQLSKSFKKQDGDEIFEDMLYSEIINYLKVHTGATITAAGDTSLELIQRMIAKMVPEILDQGLAAGASQTMLRDQIQSAWHEMKYYRTERIVRTEVNRASNFGSLEGAKSLGIELDKTWISAFSADSRFAHTAADGQTVDLNGSFIVDGESLQYPGDPAGSPGNTINCLCSTYNQPKK